MGKGSWRPDDVIGCSEKKSIDMTETEDRDGNGGATWDGDGMTMQ